MKKESLSGNADNPVKSVLYLLSGVFIFSIQDVIIKWISGKYPVHEIVLIRSFVSIIPILMIAQLDGGLVLLRTRRLVGHIIRSILMFSAYTCFYLSLSALPLAETVSLFFSAPIFITLFSAFFLREKVELSTWFAVIAGFLGVIIMLKPGSNVMEPAALLAVLTALLYAIASIITRKLGQTESGVSLAFYLAVMYMVFSVILAVVLNSVGFTSKTHPSLIFLFREWRFPARGDFIIFLSLGLIAAAGFYFLSQAYRLAKPSTIAPFEYVAVPLSIIWGYLVWRDVLEFQAIIGMVFIVGSGLYMFLGEKGFSNRYLLSLFKIKIRR